MIWLFFVLFSVAAAALEEFALVASSPFRLIVSPTSSKLSQESLKLLQDTAIDLIHGTPSDVYVSNKTRVVFQTVEFDLNATNIRFFALTQTITDGIESTDQEQLIREAQDRQSAWNIFVHSKLTGVSWFGRFPDNPQLAEASSITVVPLFRLPKQSPETTSSSNLSLVNTILIAVSVALFFAMILFVFLYRRDRKADVEDDSAVSVSEKDEEEAPLSEHVRPYIEKITVDEQQELPSDPQPLGEAGEGGRGDSHSVDDSLQQDELESGSEAIQQGCSVQATVRSMAELMKSVLQAQESEDPPMKIGHIFTDESQQSIGPFEDQRSADSSVMVHFDGTVFRESSSSEGPRTIDSSSTSDVFDVGVDTSSSSNSQTSSTPISQWLKSIRVVTKNSNRTSVASGTTISSSQDHTSLSSFVTSAEDSANALVSSDDSSSYFPKPRSPSPPEHRDEERDQSV